MNTSALRNVAVEQNFVIRADDAPRWNEVSLPVNSVDDIVDFSDVRSLQPIDEYIKDYFLKCLAVKPEKPTVKPGYRRGSSGAVTVWNNASGAEMADSIAEVITENSVMKFTDFTITARSDVKDDFLKFSLTGVMVFDNDINSPKNFEQVKSFTISHN